MISDSDMLDGINAVLAKNFTNYRVYVNLQKEDYERPSVRFCPAAKKCSAKPRTSSTARKSMRSS